MGKGILPTSPLTPFTLEKKKSEGGSERKERRLGTTSTQTRKIDKEDQSNKMKEIESHRT